MISLEMKRIIMRNYKISRRNFLAVAGTLTAAAMTACGGSASATVSASSTASSGVVRTLSRCSIRHRQSDGLYAPSPAGLADKLAD